MFWYTISEFMLIIYIYRPISSGGDTHIRGSWSWNSAQWTFCYLYVFMLLIVVTPAFDELETAGGMYKDFHGGAVVVVDTQQPVDNEQQQYD